MSDTVRDFAIARGATIMIWPPVLEPASRMAANDWPLFDAERFPERNAKMLAGMQELFGRWPSRS